MAIHVGLDKAMNNTLPEALRSYNPWIFLMEEFYDTTGLFTCKISRAQISFGHLPESFPEYK